MIRRVAAGVAALMLVGALGACGDDDDPTTTAADDTTTTAAEGGDVEEYCEAIVKIETFPEPDIDFESLSPEQLAEEGKKFGTQIQPLAEEARANAPAEIKADVDYLADSIAKIAQTGDFSTFEEDPKFEAASDKTHAYELANCGWEKVAVSGIEYAFQGIPETMPAGVTSFDLANKGKEPHEIMLLRINDDVKLSAEEIVKLPQEEGQSKAERVGGVFAEPGDEDAFVADLKSGRYFAACFIPVGGKEDGPPHASRGMVAAFEVE